jgi:hypothetical protein
MCGQLAMISSRGHGEARFTPYWPEWTGPVRAASVMRGWCDVLQERFVFYIGISLVLIS